MKPDTRFVSVIVPCRNEADWIRQCLESIVANDYPRDRLEVLVVDGMSDDGTRAVVTEYVAKHPIIRLLDNPKKNTPAALNTGIAAARGTIIMRMDAHVEYPSNYISALSQRLEESGADNVGGVCVTCPAKDTSLGRGIALGMSHPLGVGNSYFRIGTGEPCWVDTVPFGCYRREVFDRIGLFDEELMRNQDDEFNLRLIRAGGRILLVPDVVCRYYARDSLAKLWRMFYQYGYYKPLVARKIGRVMTLRQLAPPAFVATIMVSGILATWNVWASAVLAALCCVYFSAIAAGTMLASRTHGWRPALMLFCVLPTIHFSYGLGYLKGLVDFLLLRCRRSARAADIPVSR